MTDVDQEIPSENLPPGFVDSFDEVPAQPAEPVPAATVVLVRDGASGLEALLVQRARTSGFVPGAWVFPGGRVDAADAEEPIVQRADGLTAERARARLELDAEADPSALAYFLAAVREAFEETGLLVGVMVDGSPAQSSADNERMNEARSLMLEEEVSFDEVLCATGCRIAADRVEYIGHWITPLAEPRRYDTRFFLAQVPPDSEPVIDEREMIDARWLSPEEALAEHAAGRLPMIFPTIKTLEQLQPFSTVKAALSELGSRPVPTVLPRLVRTPTGVGIKLPDDEGEANSADKPKPD